jgi:hypothetical protein
VTANGLGAPRSPGTMGLRGVSVRGPFVVAGGGTLLLRVVAGFRRWPAIGLAPSRSFPLDEGGCQVGLLRPGARLRGHRGTAPPPLGGWPAVVVIGPGRPSSRGCSSDRRTGRRVTCRQYPLRRDCPRRRSEPCLATLGGGSATASWRFVRWLGRALGGQPDSELAVCGRYVLVDAVAGSALVGAGASCDLEVAAGGPG